jgi:Txe/YoeB family toxin of Txe-Axe toxin-antitoxin module
MKSNVYFATLELQEAFIRLKEDNTFLFKKVNKVLDDIQSNCFYGTQIRKRNIPADYIQKYNINNLWKVNLTSSWRLLYSIKHEKILIVSVVVDWLDHKDYERKFNY